MDGNTLKLTGFSDREDKAEYDLNMKKVPSQHHSYWPNQTPTSHYLTELIYYDFATVDFATGLH